MCTMSYEQEFFVKLFFAEQEQDLQLWKKNTGEIHKKNLEGYKELVICLSCSQTCLESMEFNRDKPGHF